MKQRLILFFKRQLTVKKQKEKSLIDQYDTLHTEWQKKVDKLENNSRKKQKDAKYREFYEKVFPELRKAREEKERLVQKQKAEQQARQEELLARQKAEADHRDFLRAEQVTLFYDEAVDIAGRPHFAARNMLANGGKELAVRCHGQSQRQIESTITAWLDRLAQTIHSAI